MKNPIFEYTVKNANQDTSKLYEILSKERKMTSNLSSNETFQQESTKACSCPVCGSSQSAPQVETAINDAADYITGDKFQVLQCSNCSLAWTAPQPTNLDRYYPAKYRRYNALILGILKTLYRIRARGWSSRFTQPGSALEIGCGDGFMLDALRSLGWSVSGTERTADMAKFASEHFGLKVYADDQEKLPSDAKFDMIVMFQVLEHLTDPLEQIKKCASLLKPGGRVIIGVPNFSSWQSKYARASWFHLDVPRHLFHHSPRSMAHLAQAANMRIDRIGFFSPEHDPFGWVQSILNKELGNQNRLTKFLMKMVKPEGRDLLTLVIAAALSPFCAIASLVSWSAKKGAIMQVELVPVKN